MNEIMKYGEVINTKGFFGLIRELTGLAEMQRKYDDRVDRYNGLYEEYCQLQEYVLKLKSENATLATENDDLSRKLSFKDEHLKHLERSISQLLDPPSAGDIYNVFNSAGTIFSSFRKDNLSGNIYLGVTNRYPCNGFVVPLGALRVYTPERNIANLAKCQKYTLFPAEEYGNGLIPPNHVRQDLRLLFGTVQEEGEKRYFWLQDPRRAQDVIVLIYALSNAREGDAGGWLRRARGHSWYENGRCVYSQICSLEQFLNSGPTSSHSKSQIERIREQCYAEYLDLYFGE